MYITIEYTHEDPVTQYETTVHLVSRVHVAGERMTPFAPSRAHADLVPPGLTVPLDSMELLIGFVIEEALEIHTMDIAGPFLLVAVARIASHTDLVLASVPMLLDQKASFERLASSFATRFKNLMAVMKT